MNTFGGGGGGGGEENLLAVSKFPSPPHNYRDSYIAPPPL